MAEALAQVADRVCPHCGNHVVHLRKGRVILRTHGPIQFDEEGAHTKCYWCKGAIDVPLSMGEEPIAKAKIRPSSHRYIVPA